MINFLLLKSLHSILGLTIIICDEKFAIVAEYKSDKTTTLYYNHIHILNEFNDTASDFLFHYGYLGETFLAYHIDNYYIIIGPWRSNAIDPLFFKKKMQEINIIDSEQDYFYKKLSNLPFFPLSQIRELLILISYCLTGIVEDKLSAPLHHFTSAWTEKFDLDKIKQFSKHNDNSYLYQYRYENCILQAVQKGDNNLLKESVSRLSNAIIPSISGDELRTEKNYSIIVYDRLSQTAIQCGLDIDTAYLSRDSFIKDTEGCQNLVEILKLRDAAILFFTQQIGKIKSKVRAKTPPTIIAVIQFLENNLNRNLKTEEIAKEFHMSESKLRNLFKAEKQITIQHYFLNLKIEAAKQLLVEGESLTHIAETFAFSSPSNFSRTFKKLVGICPTEYIQTAQLSK